MQSDSEHEIVNRAVVVGLVEQQDRPRRSARSALGAQADTLSIQLLTPFGEPFAIPLTIAGVAQGEHRLSKGRQALAVEGQVRLVGTYDRRYAHEGEAQGRRTDTMQLLVRRVREPGEGEQVGSSFVELAGAVADLPVFRDHPHLPGVEYALLTLDVTERRAPPFPGSKIVREATHKVRVAVLTHTPGAGLLYRPGNRVRLQGELDCVLVSGLPRSGAAEVLGRVQAEWAEQDARLREQPDLLRAQPGARDQAYRRYLARLRHLESTPRWRVLAGHIEPLDEYARLLSRRQVRTLRAQLGRADEPEHAETDKSSDENESVTQITPEDADDDLQD